MRRVGKAIQHARKNQRADAKRRVERVLRDLHQRELGDARSRHGLHRMDEDRRVELDGGMPELIEIKLAEIGALDIGRDDQTDGAELLHGVFGLARRGGRVRQWHGREQCEPRPGCLARRSGKSFVQQPVPAHRDPCRQSIGENVRPYREHLAGHALLRHAGEPLIDTARSSLGKNGRIFSP